MLRTHQGSFISKKIVPAGHSPVIFTRLGVPETQKRDDTLVHVRRRKTGQGEKSSLCYSGGGVGREGTRATNRSKATAGKD